MELFTILLIILAAIVMVAIYLMFFKKKLPTIIVSYSEVVGDKVIEHTGNYIATLNYVKDIMTIGKLGLKRPIPPTEVIIPTADGKKKVFLINIGINRYAYRIPTLNNQMFTFKRDQNNNIIKRSNKPVLEKYKWRYADNVLEQEDVHWMTHMRKELDEKHKAMENALLKWAAPVSLVMIFLFAIIAMNISTKQLTSDKQAIMEKADIMEEQAAATVSMVNKLLEKTSGQRVIDTEVSEREKYLNATNK